MDVVSRMCVNLWNNKELGLKLTYLRSVLQWFVLAAGSADLTTEEELDDWVVSLRMTDIIVGQVCASAQLSLVTFQRETATAEGGQTNLSPYLSLKTLVDGPKMTLALNDRQLCAVCYEPGASRPTTNVRGSEICCSDECVELHSRSAVHQV
jgi:hypothetical protein